MKPYRVAETAVVDAPADVVFDIVADYRYGHPHILPRPYFTFLEVEEGGTGAGTVIRYGMRGGGKERRFRAAVTEPVPGQVLAETDLSSATVTTFSVTPRDRERAEVEIATELMSRRGIVGAVERVATRRFLGRLYREELRLLAARAVGRPA